jgi:hypothetical protein
VNTRCSPASFRAIIRMKRAKSSFELNHEAGIPRLRTVTWNIVPWYIGSGTRFRAANRNDIKAGTEARTCLLELLPCLRAVVFVGRKASRASGDHQECVSTCGSSSRHIPARSSLTTHRKTGKLLAVLRDVARFFSEPLGKEGGEMVGEPGCSSVIQRESRRADTEFPHRNREA